MAKEKYLLVFILVLGIGLRLVNLNQSLWLDEASQALMSIKSVGEIWFGRPGDFHPPLFYLLSHYWMQINNSEVWLRLLSVLFGSTSVWLIYFLARNLAGEKFALFSALFLSINPYHVYYSQEFRGYSLLVMLGLLSMIFLQKRKYLWMAITNTLILYTHYSGIFLIIAQFVICPVTVFYFPVSIFLYIPWFPRFIEQLRGGVNIDLYLPGWRNVLSLSPLKAVPEIIFKFVAGRINLFPKWIYAIYIAFVMGVVLWGIFLNRCEKRMLWIWFAVPVVMSLVVSIWLPQTQPFRLLFVLPALIMILAGAAIRLPKTFLTLVIYISVVGNVLYFTRPRLQREQWRQSIEFLRSQNTTVVVNFFDKFAPFYWYAPGLPVVTSDRVTSDIKSFWYLEYLTGLTDPENIFKKEMENETMSIVETRNFEGVGLMYKYTRL